MHHIRVERSLIFLTIVLIMNLFSAEAGEEKRIGVLMFSEQGRYIECWNGVFEQLARDGFREPVVKLTIENARDSKAKLEGLAQKFATAKMDLIVAIGTPAAMAAARAIKDVPIVFSMVYDPVDAGIAKDWKSSGNNTTGSVTKFPLSKVLSRLKEFAPVRRLGVLYTPGQRNSEEQLLELQKIQADFRIKVVPVILTDKEEVAQTLSGVLQTVDAMYLTGSTIVGATVPIIADMANRKKVITVSHLDDMIREGALLGICLDSKLVGRLAGKKAVKILKGAKPSSIPIEAEQKLEVILNMKAAKAGQFQVPLSFMKSVTKVID